MKDQPQHGHLEPAKPENMALRLLYLLLIAIMINLAQTALGLVAVVQFLIMLLNDRRANPRVAEFGVAVGAWVARAARYQSGASEVKPWPWTALD